MHCLRVLISVVALANLALPAGAQSLQKPANGREAVRMPNPLSLYTPASAPKAGCSSTGRLDSMVKEGKLALSLNDAIALALESNLDLVIQRYTLPIADSDILGARAGGGVDSYDPVLTSSLGLQFLSMPQTSVLSTGSQQNTGKGNFTYKQAFPSGTQFTLEFDNSRTAANNPYSNLNPTVNSNLSFTLRQHLLQGFGWANNQRFLVKAKNNREIADVDFRQQVITTVTQVEKQYWNLVQAYENVKSKERSLSLAKRLLEDNQKRLESGAAAPIEVTRAESQVASDTRALLVSQIDLRSQQLHLKNTLSCGLSESALVSGDIVPIDTMKIPAVEAVEPIQDLVATALSHRPDLKKKLISITNAQIDNKANRNALLPTLDLVGSYGMSATAGVPAPCILYFSASQCDNANWQQPTGLGDAWSTIWGNKYPNYSIALSLNIPLRNRAALAAQKRSEFELRMAETQKLQLENSIRVEVRDAQDAVRQNRAAVEAAQQARRLYEESMRAERMKYDEGASTTYNVMQAQRDLTAAEADLLNAMSAYQLAQVELDRVTGTTLTNLGIDVGEVESGNIKHLPTVPNVVPMPSLSSGQNTVPGAFGK